ncbi:MAG: hypothetical protein LGR52_05165 [Candidatus Thiosymbion ectosymbiont of Robbea hypermnestra]|nr:hypothetical protein [Candidatus Thiosymbion ectosymbiont of Robbea hypermnestra]
MLVAVKDLNDMTINGIIDKSVRVIVALLYTIFIFCGFISAIASGIIEYFVFKQFFSTGATEPTLISLSPLLLVLVFETTKVFLVFYKEQLASGDIYRRREVAFLRGILITISVLCTLIFAVDRMENPKKEEVFKREQSLIDDKYDRMANPMHSQFKEIERDLDTERKTGIGERYSSLKKERSELLGKFQKLEKDRARELKQARKNSLDDQESDNPAVSGFLRAVWQVLSGNITYPRELYYGFVVVFSFLIAAGLEIVILATAYVISFNHPNILNFQHSDNSSFGLASIFKNLLIAIYFFTIFLFTFSYNVGYVFWALFLGGIFIYWVFYRVEGPVRTSGGKEPSGKFGNTLGYIREYIAPAIVASFVPALVGFASTIFISNSSIEISSIYGTGVALAAAFLGDKLGHTQRDPSI